MSATRWAEYLDDYTNYVHSAKQALDAHRDPPTNPAVTRPIGPVPDECAWKLVQLVAEATSAVGTEHSRSLGLLDKCRAATHRAIGVRRVVARRAM